ncbi:hypothetical protein [Methylobacterium sp. SyP6R]|uniref:hypothetical protein n=1 Tax=Methylobacterium sp. SyP6R TaxID=2718876 RepID=UPI001F1FDFF5|nr:hypothetical protein [Methylobacterium sp. SyP6R]MCF4127916.1 hypothetical protein [Methylobacterium sp. SyP6R]
MIDATIADRIQAAWESGRCCSLVGRAARARVMRAARLVEAGLLSPDEARRVAERAEALALSVEPLPAPPVSDDATEALS